MSRRILFIDEDQERNGSTVSMEYLVRGFALGGFDVVVLSWKKEEWAKTLLKQSARMIDGRWGPLTSPTISVHFSYTAPALSWSGMRNIAKDCIKFVLGFFRVRTMIRRVRPDVVYLNEYSVIQAALAARTCGTPAAVHVRSRMLEEKFWLRRRILSGMVLRWTDAVFAITKIEAEQFKARPEEAKKVFVVGEFVPQARESTAEGAALRGVFGLPADKKIVAMMGAIQEIKGTRDFLQAGKQALARYPGALLALAGGTRPGGDPGQRAYYDSSMEVIRELQRDDRIRLLGVIANPLDFVATADILVAPTRGTHFSRPVVEAWASGKPVVAYRTPHMEQLVEHEADGLLVEPGNVDGLAAAIVRLLEDPGLCRKLGDAGRRKATDGFDAQKNLDFIVSRCALLCGAQ